MKIEDFDKDMLVLKDIMKQLNKEFKEDKQ